MKNFKLIIVLVVFHGTLCMGSIKNYLTVIHCDGLLGKGKIEVNQLNPYNFRWFDTQLQTYIRSNLEVGTYIIEYEIEPGCLNYEIIEIIDINQCEIEMFTLRISDCGLRIWFEIKSDGKKLHPSSFYNILWEKDGIPLVGSGNEYFMDFYSNHPGEYCVTMDMHGNCCGSSPLTDCIEILFTIDGCDQFAMFNPTSQVPIVNISTKDIALSGTNSATDNIVEERMRINHAQLYPNPSFGELYATISSESTGNVLCTWTTTLGVHLFEKSVFIEKHEVLALNLMAMYSAASGPIMLTFKFPNGELKKSIVYLH